MTAGSYRQIARDVAAYVSVVTISLAARRIACLPYVRWYRAVIMAPNAVGISRSQWYVVTRGVPVRSQARDA